MCSHGNWNRNKTTVLKSTNSRQNSIRSLIWVFPTWRRIPPIFQNLINHRSITGFNLKILSVTCVLMALWYHLCLLSEWWGFETYFLQKYLTTSVDSCRKTRLYDDWACYLPVMDLQINFSMIFKIHWRKWIKWKSISIQGKHHHLTIPFIIPLDLDLTDTRNPFFFPPTRYPLPPARALVNSSPPYFTSPSHTHYSILTQKYLHEFVIQSINLPPSLANVEMLRNLFWIRGRKRHKEKQEPHEAAVKETIQLMSLHAIIEGGAAVRNIEFRVIV